MSIVSHNLKTDYSDEMIQNNDLNRSVDSFISKFEVVEHLYRCGAGKARGVAISVIFTYLLKLVFMNKSMYMQMHQGKFTEAFSKNAVYRFLDNSKANWQKYTIELSADIINNMLRDLDRVRAILSKFPDITYGFFTGETKETVSDKQRQKYGEDNGVVIPDNELLSRSEIRENPPHLLFTNYSMLEYLLIRPNDYSIFESSRLNNWKFVVLDEAHEICSNEATTKQRKQDLDGNSIIVYKPVDTIDEKNRASLQFLDLMTNIDKYSEIKGKELSKKLVKYVKTAGVDFLIVKKYLQFYPDKVYRNIYQVGLMGELI